MIEVNGEIIKEEYFLDGTFKLLNMPEPSWEDHDIILWKFENISEQVLLYNTVCYLRDRGASEIALILPYLPNARMDRVKNENECFTLKYFARFVNDLNFSIVAVLDPHSDVSAALINNIQIIFPTPYIESILKNEKIDLICFPDCGSYKRYTKMFEKIKEDIDSPPPQIYCDKVREWRTGKILNVGLNNLFKLEIKDKNILIIDDICSRDTTLLQCAEHLKAAEAAEIKAWATHCENTVFAGQLLADESPISKLYTTDSLFHKDHDKIFTFKFDVE